MSRASHKTVAKYAIAASVLAVLFGAVYSFGDALPIPTSFRDILGIASADTTEQVVLDSPDSTPSDLDSSLTTTETPDLADGESAVETDTASLESTPTESGESTPVVDPTVVDPSVEPTQTTEPETEPGVPTDIPDGAPAESTDGVSTPARTLADALRTDAVASDSSLPAMSPTAGFAPTESAFVTEPSLSFGTFGDWLSEPTTLTLTAPADALYTLYRIAGATESPYMVYETPLAFDVDGSYTIYYYSYSTDLAETAQYRTVKIDTAAPTFPEGAAVVFRTPTTTGFTASFTRAEDELSGIDHYDILAERFESAESTEVLESVESSTSADSLVVSGLDAGTYRVSVTAKDRAGNASSTIAGWVMVGHARPSVHVSIADTATAEAIASGDWITWGSSVQMAIRVESPAPSFVVSYNDLAGTSHTLASRESTPPVSQNITLTGDGERAITIVGRDTYGLESSPTMLLLKVDRTAPSAVTLLRAQQIDGTTDLAVRWGAALDQTSGIDYYLVELTNEADGSVYENYAEGASIRVTDLGVGRYDLAVIAVDVAGNMSAPQTIWIEVGAPTSGGASSGTGNSGGTTTPVTPAPGPVEPSGETTPAVTRPTVVTIDDSSRLYWIIGAAAVLAGLALIWVAAVTRAYSGKDET